MAPSTFPTRHSSIQNPTEAKAVVRGRPPLEKKYRSMEEVMQEARRVPDITSDRYEEISCQECMSGNGDEEMLLCDECDLGYHIYCLRPIVARVPTGAWFCPRCAGEKRAKSKFPLTQKKIVDFFRIQKSSSSSTVSENCGSAQDARRRKRRPISMHKKKRRLLAYTPTKDPERRLEQMASLATALTTLQMEFSNDLTYLPGMAPRSANKAILEKGGMQVLSKKDRATLDICRTMFKRGECPPLLVVFDSREGFTVQADENIKDLTFITEYCGDVDYLENRERDDCDSMMTLLLTSKPSNCLVICPDRRGNIACFISGINNHNLEGRKRQNLKCVRYDVNGECRVLLVACRDISKGEKLYYDYNGYEHEYPTQHFV